MWYEQLKSVKSKGQMAKKCNSLAELHERRKEHQGQFFTSSKLIRDAIWQIVDFYSKKLERRSIFDNSIGTGALIWNADPERDTIYGADVDGERLGMLGEALESGGFKYDLLHVGMEDLCCKDEAHFALVNPPYSIQLDSPNLTPYESNSYGEFGPLKSAKSHVYAVEQAIDSSVFTIAVLPSTYANELLSAGKTGLCAVWSLPKNAFLEAGANVATSLVVFRKGFYGKVITGRIDDGFVFNGIDGVDAVSESRYYYRSFSIARLGTHRGEPTITRPVTNNPKVEVHHNGRKIMLRFHCGFMEAKVMNRLLDTRIKSNFDNKPLPKGIEYSGQGVFDVEIHLIQNSPLKSFNERLVLPIKDCGGEPVVSPSLIGHIRNRIKQDKRRCLPFGHVYYGGSYSGTAQYKATKDVLVSLDELVSPVIIKDSVVDIVVNEAGGIYIEDNKEYQITQDRLNKEFEVVSCESEDWHERSKSKSHHYPALYKQWRNKAVKLGIDKWLDREYQLEDLIESMIHPGSFVCAWDMGLGKTRASLGTILLSGVKHGLIIVSPRLIHEFMRQIKEDLHDYIDMEDVNIIDSPEKIDNLKRFNFVTTSRLRMLVDKSKSKNKTYAKALRRRCGLVVCDEGHFISNFDTAQSRAIVALSAKKLMVMSGTIMANYPRNLHPILALIGDATAYQPWGYHNGHLKPELIDDYRHGRRGAKAFMDAFVTIDWCTYEFEDGLIKGAKREIPKIANVDAYRAALSPFVKRRVIDEPDVAKHFTMPALNEKNIYLDWDIEHLALYVKVARDFANQWLSAREDKKAISALLPRINAIIKASSRPHVGVGKFGAFTETTPKDKFTANQIKQWSDAGHKSIVYASSPDTVMRLCVALEAKGVKCLPYHGGISHTKRAQLLDNDFKKGDSQCLVATSGCLSEGENLMDCCSKVLFFERHWSAKTESQCFTRVYRPGQKNDVEVLFLHYAGGVDSYMKQMTDFKRECFKVGLDYASPELYDDEFVHMDRILGEFVEALPELEKQAIEQLAA